MSVPFSVALLFFPMDLFVPVPFLEGLCVCIFSCCFFRWVYLCLWLFSIVLFSGGPYSFSVGLFVPVPFPVSLCVCSFFGCSIILSNGSICTCQ